MKRKIGLVAGCSHSAGAEIDGLPDSEYNRNNSFGSLLVTRLGYEPLNIGFNGSANSGISRSIISWFKENYNPDEMDVFVCVGWTESARMEVPFDSYTDPDRLDDQTISWYDKSVSFFTRITYGMIGENKEQQEFIDSYHRFMANNELFLEHCSAKDVLMTQYFFKSLNIDYVMCSTSHMFTIGNQSIAALLRHIDKSRYYKLYGTDNDAFYTKYKNLGYENPKAAYWHHNEEPHRLYAEELYNFVKEQSIV